MNHPELPRGFVQMRGLVGEAASTDPANPRPRLCGMLPDEMTAADVVRLMGRGEFPQPVRIGPNRLAWRVAEVQAWLK